MKKGTKKIRYSLSKKVIPPEIYQEYYCNMGSRRSEAEKAKDSALCVAIGKQFYAARIAKGISLEELSEKSGIPLVVIEDLEAGHTLLGAHIEPYIAQYLDLTIKQVYDAIDWKQYV